MADYKKILQALLSTVYKMDEGAISEALDSEQGEDAIANSLIQLDQTRIKNLKPNESHQQAYNRAKAEIMPQFEKQIREQFGIDDANLKGVELIEAIIAAKAEGNGGTMKDEDVQKHPTFLAMERNLKKAHRDDVAAWETKYNNREAEVKKEGDFSNKVAPAILKAFKDLNPILPTSPEAAANQEANFLRSFKDGYDYQVGEDGSVTLTGKDGQPLRDAHGNLVDLAAKVREVAAQNFDFQQNNGGGNGGNGGDGGRQSRQTGKYPTGIQVPKTPQDLERLISDDNIKLEDKNAIMAAWKADNPDGQ
jgi:hypothetical protein